MRPTIVFIASLGVAFWTTGCSTARLAALRVGSKETAVAQADKAKSGDAATSAETKTAAPDKQPDPAATQVAQASSTTTDTKPAAAKPETPAAAATVTAAKPEAPAHPFQPSRPESPAASSDVATADGKTSRGPGDINKELLLLINRELEDASAEERTEWFNHLKHVDPTIVPDILRARRMTRELAAQPATAPPTDNGPAHLQSVAATAERGRTSPPATTVGLGWSNPWSQNPAAPTNDPFGVVPANHDDRAGSSAVIRADHTLVAGTPQRAEHAVYRVSPEGNTSGVVLQNYEIATGATSDQTLPAAAADPADPPSSGVPWPSRPENTATAPAAAPAAASPSRNFGTNLVQNMVGLVPGRPLSGSNQPAAGPSGIAQASAQQPVEETFTQQLEQTIAYVERDVARLSPTGSTAAQGEYLRLHVVLRLLYLMAHQQERALTAIPNIPPAEQEFWQQLIWGMANALDHQHMPEAKDRATQTITQLNSAIRRLQEQADLQIRHATFCHQILYFGNYEKLPRNEFSPGQEVLLYAELDNFKSDPTADGQYRTLLRSSIEILSPNGELRKQIDFPATEDLCSTYRRDYFHNYQFRIPERMPLGPHVLKLTVVDELSGKLSSYTVNFLVK